MESSLKKNHTHTHTDKLRRDMKELIITKWGRAASQRRKHHNEHLHYQEIDQRKCNNYKFLDTNINKVFFFFLKSIATTWKS